MVLLAVPVLGATSGADPATSQAAAAVNRAGAPVPVAVVGENGGFTLLRDGKPYEIKGAGIEFGDIAALARHGGNSMRTWRTNNGVSTGQEILDEAARHGVTVALCIEIGRERHGFDYDDEQAVAQQLARARSEVLKYKDHPALLMWIIGNEPNLHFRNPGVFDAINDISKMIHALDGLHPTTTALAGFDAELAELMTRRAPDLDVVSVQFYGKIVDLPRYLAEFGYAGPLMVTEWGAIGHWEVPKTEWGAPIEQNSTEKAQSYRRAHEIAIASNPTQIIGSYVFLWGQKQERTPTWYGVFLEDGTETESVDLMHYLWNGKWPRNRAPGIESLVLDGRTAHENVVLNPGKQYAARVAATDLEADPLRYRWEIMRESEATQTGGDEEDVPELITGLIDGGSSATVTVTAPDEAGAYRLFVYVYDGQGHAGHANIPFLVRSAE